MSASYQVLIKMVIKGNVKFLHWLKRSLIKMKKIANVTAADPALIVSGEYRLRFTMTVVVNPAWGSCPGPLHVSQSSQSNVSCQNLY